MALYHKHRPASFGEIEGNKQLVEALGSVLSDKKGCPHALLLHGPTGCGKTTLARIIASKLDVSGMDYVEVDSADFRGIDTIRAIRKNAQYKPLEGACRVWILDECHKLSNDAQNALLKILEDTPRHVYFILCTTEPTKLIPTIRGRCSQYNVSPLNENQMMRLLRRIVKAEGETLQKLIYQQIIQDSFGHSRNALQILEQVLAVEPGNRLETAKRVAETQSQSIELCRALLQKTGWKKIANILKGLKEQEAESIRRHVLGYCEAILLKGENDRAGLVMELFINPFYNSGWPGLVFACYSIIKGG